MITPASVTEIVVWGECMNISKSALWLSVIDAFLVLVASASGILLKSIYARETPSWAVQGMSQDIVNLVVMHCGLFRQQGIGQGVPGMERGVAVSAVRVYYLRV